MSLEYFDLLYQYVIQILFDCAYSVEGSFGVFFALQLLPNEV